MARNLQLALTLTAKDTGSQVLRKAMADAVTATKNAERASTELATTQQKASSTGIQASRALVSEFQRAANARETLGIRSERQIQREIQQTMAAYNRLTRSGMLSANDQRRAFAAMTEQLTRLRTELNGTASAMGKFERLRNAGSNAMAVTGGVATAVAVIKDPVKRQMAFNRRNAEIANTAYNKLSPEERIQKIPVINNAIREAVRYGGGTPESAQSTLNTLFAGGLDDDVAIKMLPDITKNATASGANPEELAKIGIGAIKNFGIKLEDLPKVYDKVIRSGENGKYELSDMAGSLPKTMSKANAVGMSGLNDLDKLLAMLQANAETAGENGAASTNVDNLLDKYTSSDTQNALKNYKFRIKGGKPLGYTDYMAQKRLQGVSASDAFTEAIDGIVSGDKRVQHLRAEAKKYKGTDKEKDILAALDVVVSSITSKIVADQQAGMALKTSILKRDFIKEQIAGTKDADGAGAASFEVVSSTPDYKSQQFESEKIFSEQDAVKPVADGYADLITKLTKYASEYPELTTALSSATLGIKMMTSAAMVFAGLKFLSGGGVSAPPVPGPVPGSGTPTPAGGWMARFGGIGRLAGKVAAPFMVYQAAQDAPLVQVERGDAAARERLQKSNYKSDTERMKDVLKAQPGALDAWDEVKAWWSKPSTIGQGAGGVTPSYLMQIPQQPVATPAPPQPITHVTRLEVDGRVLAEAVNEYNGQQAVRGSVGGGY
ncbi:phage tail tape measure protein [Dickeya dianthicola]|uniref:phage tail tape measure protein n=1 Tax=Dickeya dianthicola TaxID=204039 RepID=UPI00136BF844|nr:phage tail tape measure protein [Dickeya dianthicola]MCI4235935.1 phage tail tape measure protein [Dickeya dianthicola]MCI4253908.1 phage tail tape measure protein [Dickeya dianthicola]MZG20954.1 phage tail tape measure protein [Dickeya dianthicola]